MTAMLVLTTLLNQVSANLPRNSYFKALDIWMFGAIGLIFSILILQTVADVMKRREEDAGAAKVDSMGSGRGKGWGGVWVRVWDGLDMGWRGVKGRGYALGWVR